MWLPLLCMMAITHGLDGQNISIFKYLQNSPSDNWLTSYLGNRVLDYGKSFMQEHVKRLITDTQEPKTRSSRGKRGIMDMMNYFFILRNVSQPCQNSFLGMISSITGIFSGKFPATLGTSKSPEKKKLLIVSNINFIIYDRYRYLVIDASGKYTSGTIRGNKIRKGNYQECIEIKANQELNSENDSFVGQFCHVTAEYDPNYLAPNSVSQKQFIAFQNGFLSKFLMFQDYMEYQIYPGEDREIFEIQVCVPSLCNPNDVASLVSQGNSSTMLHDARNTIIKFETLSNALLLKWRIFARSQWK